MSQYRVSTCGHPSAISQVPLATMATTSAAGLALWRHVIPLVSAYNETAEGSQDSLSRYVTIDGTTKEKRKYNIPLVSSPDVETLCRCVLEFDDVSAVPRLSLTMGPLKFSFFRQCLSGTIRDKWDVLADGVNETLLNFTAARDRLIGTPYRLGRSTALPGNKQEALLPQLCGSHFEIRNDQQNDVPVPWGQW